MIAIFVYLLLIVNDINGMMKKPHIIFIMADDMGINDLSFMGSDNIPTPNIDALAFNGVILKNHYATPMCTPSRASLMTGKYPIHLGLQDYVIVSDTPFGLGLEEKLMPEYFKESGYKTVMVGKWHLGFYRQAYTPTNRGFDSFYGYLGPYIDYYKHNLKMENRPYTTGYDLRRNLSIDRSNEGQYATDMFTDFTVNLINEHDPDIPLYLQINHLAPHTGNDNEPMQAKPEVLEKFSYISDINRRYYAAMVWSLDESVGRIVKALNDKQMLDNSVIIFISDNGAPTQGMHSNSGSNGPLRGQKHTPWDGAARTPAIIWSSLIKHPKKVVTDYMHISDWLPTFSKLAKYEFNEDELDGINQWNMISMKDKSKREDVLINLSSIGPYYAYINKSYKIVIGTTNDGTSDYWYGQLNESEVFPQSVNYSKFIKDSTVGQILNGFTMKNHRSIVLYDYEITSLRNKAKITCYPHGLRLNVSHQSCYPIKAPCLFHIESDPCEMFNLADTRPDVLKLMLDTQIKFSKTMKQPRNRPADPRCDPGFFNDTWTWWWDELKITDPNEDGSSNGTSNNLISVILSLFSVLCCCTILISIR